MSKLIVESDDSLSGYYRAKGLSDYGFAWLIAGWEAYPPADPDDERESIRTGRLVAQMVGDDVNHFLDPDELERVDGGSFCGVCGQFGCSYSSEPEQGEG